MEYVLKIHFISGEFRIKLLQTILINYTKEKLLKILYGDIQYF